MKFSKPNCPTCGELVRGIVEVIHGCAELSLQEDGETFEYAGSTDVWWDEQRPERDKRGRVRLICHDAHEWFSKVIDHPEETAWMDKGGE